MIQSFPFSDSVVEMLSRPTVRLGYAFEGHARDGVARAHTGIGPLVIDGHTFDGVGDFANVSPAREALNSTSPYSVTLTLSGLSHEVVAYTTADRLRGRFGRLMVVAYDDLGNYAADVLVSGTMDAAEMSYAGSEGENAISVTITDRMVDWQRPGTERWNDENQRHRHDDDRFFYAIDQMADWPIYWGAKRDAPSFTYR